jgi:hypothetical protein
MNHDEQFLGLVKNNKLSTALPESEAVKPVRLTEMPIQTLIPAEAQEISLKKHEGKAIMVVGRCSSDWIYSAEIIDLASPIVTALLKRYFASRENCNWQQ